MKRVIALLFSFLVTNFLISQDTTEFFASPKALIKVSKDTTISEEIPNISTSVGSIWRGKDLRIRLISEGVNIWNRNGKLLNPFNPIGISGPANGTSLIQLDDSNFMAITNGNATDTNRLIYSTFTINRTFDSITNYRISQKRINPNIPKYNNAIYTIEGVNNNYWLVSIASNNEMHVFYINKDFPYPHPPRVSIIPFNYSDPIDRINDINSNDLGTIIGYTNKKKSNLAYGEFNPVRGNFLNHYIVNDADSLMGTNWGIGISRKNIYFLIDPSGLVSLDSVYIYQHNLETLESNVFRKITRSDIHGLGFINEESFIYMATRLGNSYIDVIDENNKKASYRTRVNHKIDFLNTPRQYRKIPIEILDAETHLRIELNALKDTFYWKGRILKDGDSLPYDQLHKIYYQYKGTIYDSLQVETKSNIRNISPSNVIACKDTTRNTFQLHTEHYLFNGEWINDSTFTPTLLDTAYVIHRLLPGGIFVTDTLIDYSTLFYKVIEKNDSLFVNPQITTNSIQWYRNDTLINSGRAIPTNRIKGKYHYEVKSQGKCMIESKAYIYEPNSLVQLNQLGVRIYPNPLSDYLKIRNKSGNQITLMIFDTQGKIILNESIPVGETQITTRNLKAGVYLAHIIQHNQIFNIKVTKQ